MFIFYTVNKHYLLYVNRLLENKFNIYGEITAFLQSCCCYCEL